MLIAIKYIDTSMNLQIRFRVCWIRIFPFRHLICAITQIPNNKTHLAAYHFKNVNSNAIWFRTSSRTYIYLPFYVQCTSWLLMRFFWFHEHTNECSELWKSKWSWFKHKLFVYVLHCTTFSNPITTVLCRKLFCM